MTTNFLIPPPSLFADSRTIAVVGLSDKPHRPSHTVAQLLQKHGYRIIPVNPLCAGTYILGEYCYASLLEAAVDLKKKNCTIDIVDCFRKSADIPPIADEAISIGAKYLWMQSGIVNAGAAAKARAAGLTVIMDRCLKIDYMQWRTSALLDNRASEG